MTTRQSRHRLARRLLGRARQPAVGARQAAGAGVLRRPRSRDREGAERGRAQATDRRTLPATNPPLHAAFVAAKRRADGDVATSCATSGRYPLCGRGDINTYAVFAEADRNLIGGDGRLGVILPTGIATDATTQYFFKDLVENGSISSLYDFENAKPLFEAVHSSFKFCLLTLAGRDMREPEADFAFFAHDPTDLQRAGCALHPHAGRDHAAQPEHRHVPGVPQPPRRRDHTRIYRRVPVLIREGDPDGNPWGIKFMTMFHMSNDSHLFHTRDELEADGWTSAATSSSGGGKRDAAAVRGQDGHHYDHRAAAVVTSATAAMRQNQPRYLRTMNSCDPMRQ